MKLINKIIYSLLVVSSFMYADIGIDSVGLNVGCANIYTEQTNKLGSITLANQPDEQYLHGEIYALIGGVFDDKSWKPSINYMLSDNDDFTNHMLMAGINKYFFQNNYNLYVGALVGTGMLNWKYDPLNDTKDNDTNVQSLVGAFQIGAEFPLTDSFSLGLNAKYYIHDYLTILEPTPSATSEISHNNSCSIAIGIRYSFGVDEKKQAPVKEQVLQETPVEEKQEVVAQTIAVIELDSDNDGVVDSKDECADTQSGFSVDEKGCEKTFTFNMKFSSSSSEILPQYKTIIEAYAKFLTKNTGYKSEVIAYTDSSGKVSSNQKLSEKRAKVVAEALVDLGVSAERVSYRGMGANNPIATNDTPEGREQNRRIEATLTK